MAEAALTNFRSESPFDDPTRMGGTFAVAQKETSGSKLDSDDMKRLHRQLMNWFRAEQDKQGAERFQRSLDEAYYDGEQWSQEDAAVLAERLQQPLVYNLIKPGVNWLLGTEKRTRTDFKVLPRGEEDSAGAETKTKVLKYLADVNNTRHHRSHAFAESVKAGIGWLEDGITAEPEQELIYSTAESWRNILEDSNSRKADCSDMRFIFRWRALDTDIAASMFEDRRHIIQISSAGEDQTKDELEEYYLGSKLRYETGEDWRFNRHSATVRPGSVQEHGRQNVIVFECWYRVPQRAKVLRGGEKFDGEIFDPYNEEQQAAVRDGLVSLATTTLMKMHCAIFTTEGLLWHGPSPYRHNRFPFTPIYCYRRARDGMPYGVIRDIRDPQDDFNKRASKALWYLSSNVVEGEVDALGDEGDIEELRAEAARPDAMLLRKKGTELRITRGAQFSREEMNYAMTVNYPMVQQIAGVTGENLGRDTSATSGIAIARKQEQGSTVTYSIFENFMFARQLQGEKQLALTEQFMTAPKVLRIVGPKGKMEWLPINREDPQTGEVINDITASKADFVLDETDYRASTREAMFEAAMNSVTKMPPEMAMKFMDLVWELSDAPNKADWMARVRQATGAPDPNREPTPQEQQAMAQVQAKQAAMDDLAMREVTAKVEKAEAEVASARADLQAKQQAAQANPEMAQQIANQYAPQLQAMEQNYAKLQQAHEQLQQQHQQQVNARSAAVESAQIKANAEVQIARENREAAQAQNETVKQGDAANKTGFAQSVEQFEEMISAVMDEVGELKAKLEEKPAQTEPLQRQAPPINLTVSPVIHAHVDARRPSVSKTVEVTTDENGNAKAVVTTKSVEAPSKHESTGDKSSPKGE